MKYDFKHVEVHSRGDYKDRDWKELLIELHLGWEIISGISDEYKVHYILRRELESKEV